jgi:SAM-dependent methyltransferase
MSFLLRDYGSRRDCLSLGSGLGRVERFLIDQGFTERFDTIELNPHVNRLASRAHASILAQAGDLNFVHLPEARYDFILCHGVLHHLINLEHVLFQVNRALKDDGLLLIYEYIGETRWQFTPDRLRALSSAYPRWAYRVPAAWQVQGFEAVRSGDLSSLIDAQFGAACKRKVCYGGVYFPFVTCTKAEADSDIERVVELDAELSTAQRVRPCYVMGLYGKSTLPKVPATPWSDAELRGRLTPTLPFHAKVRDVLRDSAIGPYLRSAKRLLMTSPR